MHIVIEDGKKITIPRYLKNKIYNEHQRKAIGHYQMQKIAERDLENRAKYTGTDYDRDMNEYRAALFYKQKQSKYNDKI